MRTIQLFIIALLFPFMGFAQDINLAKNYYDQGEYAKAETIFKKLYKENPGNVQLMESLVASYQQQQKYTEAGDVLEAFQKRVPQYPGLDVEIGWNYFLQGDENKADSFYTQALEEIEKRANTAFKTGNNFHNYGLLNHAETAFKKGLEHSPNATYSLRLAEVYGEQGKLSEMFSTYLDLILDDPQYFYSVNRYFSEFITENPDDEANTILRKILIQRLQKHPEIAYNQILSWLYIQENEFKKAFVQEKALFQRSENKSLLKLNQLADLAADKDEFAIAEEVLTFTYKNSFTENQRINSYSKLLALRIRQDDPKQTKNIRRDFENFFEEYGKTRKTLDVQLQYAQFLAYKENAPKEAKNLLQEILKSQPNPVNEARIKMLLGDILVIEENFNQALIYYSQIKNLAKNSEMAQEALFKVAQTSYYKGDFDWAQTQLKILKESTSELTANDALALNLLIEDNIAYDSTQTALKLFAKADLLSTQEKYSEALQLLDTILTDHQGERIEEDALYRSAKLLEKTGDYLAAETTFQKVLEYYPDGIMADKATYALAELYRKKLNDSEKAMDYYKKIIFDHADSIYFVDSRNKYRQLRGDAIQ